MSQALYRKWRPIRFADVVGQEHITHTLQNGIAADRIGHAFLFCGPRGTGKTTSARLLAKAVNCLHQDSAQRPCNQCHICQAVNTGRFLDLIEIDAASNTGVDDIRDLRDKVNFSPSEGRFKVYIIDEVHMLSTAAFNALLKTLEEPPPHAKFVLATTEEHKVPVTIKSRCQIFQFRLLTVGELMERLNWLVTRENLQIEPEALALIARQGAGSVRDAESLLDQLVIAPGDIITLDRVRKVLGTASQAAVIELVESWLAGDGAKGLGVIHRALSSGTDARQMARQMVAFLRALLLMQTTGHVFEGDVPAESLTIMRSLASCASRAALIAAIKSFQEAAITPTNSWQPQLLLELAFVELLPEVSGVPASLPTPVLPTTTQSPINNYPPATAHDQPIIPNIPPPIANTPQTLPTVDPQPIINPQPPIPTHQPPTDVTLLQITASWAQAMSLIKQKARNLGSLLASCKPLAVEKDVVILGFDYPLLKDKFDHTANASQLMAETLSGVVGQPCQVRTVMSQQYLATMERAGITPEEFRSLANELGGIIPEQTPSSEPAPPSLFQS